MGKQRRWPTLDEIIENAKRGIIDDRQAAVPPYDLQDWEINGDPEPEDHSEPSTPPVRSSD